ncbi:hypothetical protein CA54_42940 [Symmachiella macrocystis]|uniref:Uncharacterized protein n=1 Tax=Symmachiella macrocystis TaxID=2527985 RepID=A0A5C6BF06_9PLAN|nr:hypothetical protein [Symmachiella macrocystis]TWU09054.1 hypothetical protein CA54_42940 [Symmachiella macrocystis]
MFPGFDNVYRFSQNASDRSFHADLIGDETTGEALLRGEWSPKTTLPAHWAMGKAEPLDIAWGRHTAWYYISPKVLQLFNQHGITGWSTYPIELHNKAGEVYPGYAGLSITGRCGPIDVQGGEIEPGQKEGRKFIRRIGLFFDESTWDGSDFFCPEGNNTYTFATARVKNLLDENNIRGLVFTPLAETTWISRPQK